MKAHNPFSFLLLLLLTTPAFLWSQVTFTAEVPSKKVGIHSVFKVSFVIRNAPDVEGFEPPALEDFEVVGGLERGMSSSIINGKSSMEVYYSLQLKPRRTGQLTIGRAKAKVRGRWMMSREVTIEVVQDAPSVAPVLLVAEPVSRNVFLNEPVQVDFKLYVKSDLRRNRLADVEPPTSPGFLTTYLNFQQTYTEERNGVRYNVWVISRAVLFPQQTGKVTFGSMQIDVDIAEDDGFWGLSGSKRYRLESDPIVFTVAPLPDQAPPSFLGGVGAFEYEASLSETAITTDDAVTLRLVYRGTGDIKQVAFPKLDFGDSLDVYDPAVLRDEMVDNYRGEYRGERILEYPLIPTRPGTYRIETPFSYFHPDSGRYITIRPGPFEFRVAPGKVDRDISRERRTVADLDALTLEDLPPVKEAARLKSNRSAWTPKPTFWVFFFLPVLLVPILFAVKKQQERKEGMDPALVRQRKASKVALARLSEAKQQLDARNDRAFHDAVSKALLGYVTDKLQLPPATLSKQNIHKNLLEAGASAEWADQSVAILSTCELVLFAGKQAEEAARVALYEQTLALVDALEQAL